MDLATASAPKKIRASFFKDVDGKRDMVELKIIGDPNTLILKVKPDHVMQFPREWEAYQAGSASVEIPGTPLTEVPGIDRNAALAMKLAGVRTAEELANLDEAAAKGLGMGGLTFWNSAKNLVKLRQLEAMQAVVEAQSEKKRAKKDDAN